MQAIGEAAGKLDPALRADYELPWKAIIGQRQILSHDYLAVSFTIVWKTATENLGELKDACRDALEKASGA